MKAMLSLLLTAGLAAAGLVACEPREQPMEQPPPQQDQFGAPAQERETEQDREPVFGEQDDFEQQPQAGEQQQPGQQQQQQPGAQPGQPPPEQQVVMQRIDQLEAQLSQLRQSVGVATEDQLNRILDDIEQSIENVRDDLQQMDQQRQQQQR